MKFIILILIFIFSFIPASYSLTLADAQRDYVKGDYESALRKARSLAQSDEVLYFLGVVSIKTEDYSTARKYLQELIQRFPKSYFYPPAMVKLADTYFLQKDYKNAAVLYQEVKESCPIVNNMPLVLLRLAQIAAKEGNWAEKEKYLNIIKEKYPQSAEMKLVKTLESYGEFFTIQVGAFTNRDKALAFMEELRKEYDEVHIVTEKYDNYDIHKVRIGRFKKRYDVEKIAAKLRSQGYSIRIYP
jgi:Tfp pilus assembly protein PilF